MVLFDANMILRYLLCDNREMAEQAARYLIECDVVDLAVQTYGSHNLDFVDCVLYAYHRVEGVQIATFDKQLLKLIDKQ